jgi:cytochrome b involved in lipid metabolism
MRHLCHFVSSWVFSKRDLPMLNSSACMRQIRGLRFGKYLGRYYLPLYLEKTTTCVRMASDIRAPMSKSGQPREKVALKPGFHLVDWHRLMQAGNNLNCRDGGPPRRISMEELQKHNTEFDCWTVYNGKVYNVTQYMHYHPGGVKKIMIGAGKDCTKYYDKFHPWVNIETMLAKCYVGPLGDGAKSVIKEASDEDDEDDPDDKLDKEMAASSAADFKVPVGELGSDIKAKSMSLLTATDSDEEQGRSFKK